MRNKIISAEEAAQRVPDGATLGTIGGGGGLVEADTLLAAIEARFLETGHPRFGSIPWHNAALHSVVV